MDRLGMAAFARSTVHHSLRLAWSSPILPMLLGASLALDGCGNSGSRSTAVDPCNVDADCSGGQICKHLSTPGARAETVAPCPYLSCATSDNCPSGEVCAPIGLIVGLVGAPPCDELRAICTARCEAAGCAAGYTCQSDGTCRLLQCNEPGAMACPATFHCDPARAAFEPSVAAGSPILDDSAAIARGCVRKRCNEAGGYACRDFWSCQPDASTDGSGCVALPCTATGHCSDDTLYICAPTSNTSRREGYDAHGCARRNCEEGLPCQYTVANVLVGYCDFSGPFADLDGCAARPCLESANACEPGHYCEAVSELTDARGCRPPKCYTVPCPSNAKCEPDNASADSNGCVARNSGTGGAGSVVADGGAAGSSTERSGAGDGGDEGVGSAGAGGSGENAAGSGSSEPAVWVGTCVER